MMMVRIIIYFKGYITLVDFGFVKEGKEYSRKDSAQYESPEMVKH